MAAGFLLLTFELLVWMTSYFLYAKFVPTEATLLTICYWKLLLDKNAIKLSHRIKRLLWPILSTIKLSDFCTTILTVDICGLAGILQVVELQWYALQVTVICWYIAQSKLVCISCLWTWFWTCLCSVIDKNVCWLILCYTELFYVFCVCSWLVSGTALYNELGDYRPCIFLWAGQNSWSPTTMIIHLYMLLPVTIISSLQSLRRAQLESGSARWAYIDFSIKIVRTKKLVVASYGE